MIALNLTHMVISGTSITHSVFKVSFFFTKSESNIFQLCSRLFLYIRPDIIMLKRLGIFTKTVDISRTSLVKLFCSLVLFVFIFKVKPFRSSYIFILNPKSLEHD